MKDSCKGMSQLAIWKECEASIPIPHLGKNLFFHLSGKVKAKLRGSMDDEILMIAYLMTLK